MRWLKAVFRTPLRAAGYDLRRLGVAPDPVDTVAALLADRPTPVVFDIGANEGQTVARFRPGLPRAVFHCFEPDPSAFERLTANTADDPNVKRHRCGVGDAPGTLLLRVNQSSGTNSFLAPVVRAGTFSDHPDFTQVSEAHAEVTTVDRFCSANGVEWIDLLKIDTQGFEDRVLKGAEEKLARRAVRLVFLEVSFVPLYEGQAQFDELCGLLRRAGYKLVDLFDRDVHREVGLIQANALFQPAER